MTVATGIPRSGTSLPRQMLAAGGMPVLHDASRPADVDDPRGGDELGAVKATRRDASWLVGAGGHAVELDTAAMAAQVDPGLHRQRSVPDAVL